MGLASGWAGPKMEEGDGAGSAGKRGFKQASPAFVTAGEMSKMKDASAFHEAFTLPFTGDATVEAFFERIERIMGSGVSSVRGVEYGDFFLCCFVLAFCFVSNRRFLHV